MLIRLELLGHLCVTFGGLWQIHGLVDNWELLLTSLDPGNLGF